MDGATAVVRSLEAHDVEYLFGVCGDTSVGLYHALATLDHSITHVLARDERSASFMADAYARLSGKPGVCEGPSGGGATYLIPGLAEANDSSIPVIGLNTDIPVRYRGRGVLTELDQGALFDPVTKWNTTVDHADLIPPSIRRAFRRATTGRPGAVHLAFPMDVLNATPDATVYAAPETSRYPATRPPPAPEDVEAAATIIDDATRPVIIAGGGVYSTGAATQLRAFAEQTGIPVAQTLTATGCVGESPYSVGVIGENGGRVDAENVVRDADVVLLLGTAVESVWTHKWTLLPDDAAIIHADIDAENIGRNYRPTVSIPGDLRTILDALSAATDAQEQWPIADLQARRTAWLEDRADWSASDAFPLHPERLVHDTNDVLADDAVIVSDPGTTCPYFAAFYDFPLPGRHWVTPRAHGALGYAIPGVVGAYFARPDHQIVGFTGDGSFGTTAGELETLARAGLPVTIVLVNNGAFSWIEAGQRNYADFSWGVDFDTVDYAAIADAFGLTGFRVDAAADYAPTLDAAIQTDGPALVDLPVKPLPTIEDPPVEWLTPAD